MPAAKGSEDLFEVELLPAVGHVNNFRGLPGLQSIPKRRQVSGGVVKAAVALLNDGGVIFLDAEVVQAEIVRPAASDAEIMFIQ